MNKDEAKKSLESTVAAIEKRFGKGSIMQLNATAKPGDIPSISTGSFSLDTALGIGGLPRGRIVEIFGSESAGKSTLALSVIAQAQKMGGNAAYVDAEHALNPSYAKVIGVDLENLILSQPDSAEQALEITEQLVQSGGLDVVVVDSVAALVPQAEIEGEMGDVQMGSQARLMSKALRKLTGAIHKTNTIAIFINQLRQKVGVVFGNPEVTPGGQALKFYSSVRIDLRRRESLKTGNDITGIRVRARVVKNKMAPPFRNAEFDIVFTRGLARESEVLAMAIDAGIVKRAGSIYSWGDKRLGQGKEAAYDYLTENPKERKELEKAILSKVN